MSNLELFLRDKNERYSVLHRFTSGKSRDIVLRVERNSKTFIFKLGLDELSIKREIDLTYNTYNVFKKYKHKNPVVRIICSGSEALFQGQWYHYYIMEDLSVEYETMHEIIERNCKLEKWVDDIPVIMRNLFNVIAIMKTHFISHCDLHTQNILVHRTNKQIKIIDLNMSARICTKKRMITATILKEYVDCRNSLVIRQLKNFLKQLLIDLPIDSDVFMFIKILGLFYYDEEKFQILKLIQSQLYQTTVSGDEKNMKLILSAFKNILKLILI